MTIKSPHREFKTVFDMSTNFDKSSNPNRPPRPPRPSTSESNDKRNKSPQKMSTSHGRFDTTNRSSYGSVKPRSTPFSVKTSGRSSPFSFMSSPFSTNSSLSVNSPFSKNRSMKSTSIKEQAKRLEKAKKELQASERKLEKARNSWENVNSSIVISTNTRPPRQPSARKNRTTTASVMRNQLSSRINTNTKHFGDNNDKSKALKEEKIDRKLKTLHEKMKILEMERALARVDEDTRAPPSPHKKEASLDKLVGNLPGTKYGYIPNDELPSVRTSKYYSEIQDQQHLDETISTLSMNDDSGASTESSDEIDFIDDFKDSLSCAVPVEEYIFPASTDLDDHSYSSIGTDPRTKAGTEVKHRPKTAVVKPMLEHNSLYSGCLSALSCFLCGASGVVVADTDDTSVESEETSIADSSQHVVPIEAIKINNQIAMKTAKFKAQMRSHKLAKTTKSTRKQQQAQQKVTRRPSMMPITSLKSNVSLESCSDSGRYATNEELRTTNEELRTIIGVKSKTRPSRMQLCVQPNVAAWRLTEAQNAHNEAKKRERIRKELEKLQAKQIKLEMQTDGILYSV